jgi:UDP-N-acetylmuramoyl-L-alanyl-D-glutamate--2,6-diaminopimelate ligase
VSAASQARARAPACARRDAAHDITADSRKAGPGCIFAAWPGQRTDGRRFLADAGARRRGSAAVGDADGFGAPALDVPALGADCANFLPGARRRDRTVRPPLGKALARRRHRHQRQDHRVADARAGARRTRRALRHGRHARLRLPDALEEGLNTTPDALTLHARWFARFRARGRRRRRWRCPRSASTRGA